MTCNANSLTSLLAATVLGLCLSAPFRPEAAAADLALHESGSTLLYPLFRDWGHAYEAVNAGTTISTEATGTGAGIAKAIAGEVQIGASDAYMSDEQAEHN